MSDAAPTIAIEQLGTKELSFHSKIGHVLLLLASCGMLILLLSLLITEEGLPSRTWWSFAGMTGIAAAWTGYTCWVLSSHRPLIARHRVVAGWMAMLFSAAFLMITGVAGLLLQSSLFGTAFFASLPLTALSIVLYIRARTHVAELETRRLALEQSLGGS